MTRKDKPKRLSQPVYCFIVEGDTEENYITLLKSLYRKSGKIDNRGGGSAKKVMETAQKIIERDGDYYSGYVIWFDTENDEKIKYNNLKKNLKRRSNVEIYISEPCVENWLLAHFEKIRSKDKPVIFYKKELQRYIPNYDKADYHLLARYIHQAEVDTAIANYPEIGNLPKKYFRNEELGS